MGRRPNLAERIRSLDRRARLLVGLFTLMGLVALAVGGVAAFVLVLDDAGFFEFSPITGYKMLTLHATSLFNFWLYFIQVGIVLLFIMLYTPGARLSGAPLLLAYSGLALMSLGFLASVASILRGSYITYAAIYPLAEYVPNSSGLVLGLLLLYLGLMLAGAAGLYIPLRSKVSGLSGEWSSVTYASFIWFGLLIITSIASLLVYLPEFFSLITGESLVQGYRFLMSWGVMFHNLHYLPILAVVLTWYVLSEALVGIKSVYGEGLSKAIFTLYLAVIPPTSVYHFFLEPSLPLRAKMLGSILSLGVSLPTIAVALLILSSWEVSIRSELGLGLGWVRRLPWGNPAFMAMSMGMVSALGGGVLANVVIQERVETLTGDTLVIPAYFHLFTIGAITLTYLGLLLYLIPGITGRGIAYVGLLRALPPVVVLGTYIFALGGVWAGYLGVPRRTLDFYPSAGTPSEWLIPLYLMGIGALIALLAGSLLYVLVALAAIRGGNVDPGSLETLDVGRPERVRVRPVYAYLVIVSLLAGIYVATLLAYWVMESIPIDLG